jgi:hypothetical protein
MGLRPGTDRNHTKHQRRSVRHTIPQSRPMTQSCSLELLAPPRFPVLPLQVSYAPSLPEPVFSSKNPADARKFRTRTAFLPELPSSGLFDFDFPMIRLVSHLPPAPPFTCTLFPPAPHRSGECANHSLARNSLALPQSTAKPRHVPIWAFKEPTQVAAVCAYDDGDISRYTPLFLLLGRNDRKMQ